MGRRFQGNRVPFITTIQTLSNFWRVSFFVVVMKKVMTAFKIIITPYTLLKSHGVEPIDNEYYDALFRRNNIYSNDPSKLKKKQMNYQQVIQGAIDDVLRDKIITSFEKLSDTLAKNHDIEVYKFSKNSNKLGYVLYKKEANFYENREKFIFLGEDKASRKIRESYVEKTFSAKKLGKGYELESIDKELDYNLMDYRISNLDNFNKEEQFIILNKKIIKQGN